MGTLCGRKKRMISVDEMPRAEVDLDDLDILPSSSLKFVDLEEPEIESMVKEDMDDEAERNPRFMIYWTTIVTTSYSTSYTSTSTIATVLCTPSGFTLFSTCGK